MCGDLDEDDAAGDRAFEAFRQHATHLTRAASRRGDPDDVNAYLDRLFADLLGRIADASDAPGVSGAQRLSLTPLVFARLAGLIAGHAPLAEDPLRRTLEALMMGYAEPETRFRDRSDHHHDHDHSHDHHH